MNAKSTIRITLALTDEYRQSQLISTGKLPDRAQVVEYDLTQATPEQRTIIARATNGTLNDLRLVNAHPEWTCYNGIPDIATLTATLAADLAVRDEHNRARLNKFIADHVDSVIKATAERKAKLPSWCEISPAEKAEIKFYDLDLSHYNDALADYIEQQPTFAAEEAALKAKSEAYEAERKAKSEAEKAEREQQKQDWIAAHGSEHLKRACIQHGHNCQRKYVTERAAIEAPGYVVDFDDSATWKERSCPSLAALDELDAAIEKAIGDAEIVWLTATGNDETDYDFDGCEAVVIRNYQGKYDLIKQI